MSKIPKSLSRLKENFAVYRDLRKGAYDAVLEEFLETLEKDSNEGPSVILTKMPGDAIVAQIRQMIAQRESWLMDLINRMQCELLDAKSCDNVLVDIAAYTKWRLGFDLVFAALFGSIGAFGFLTKRKLAGAVGLLASFAHVLAFLDELDIRRTELDDQLKDLQSICDGIKDDLSEYNLQHTNYEFVKEVMLSRFGEVITSKNPDPDDLMETYDPDADPAEPYYE